MFTWRYVDGAGADGGRSEPFADRDAAEAWLGVSWRELLDQGFVAVELLDGDDVAYRMGLTPE